MTLRRLAVLALLFLSATGVQAQAPCADMFSDKVPFMPRDTFFSHTSFGTIGFTRDSSDMVYVPDRGVSCVTVRRPKVILDMIFNHRGAAAEGTGYVSFKIFAFSDKPRQWVRKLTRAGAWERNRMPLQDPWSEGPVSKRDPAVVQAYEAFYRDEKPGPVESFDRQFGAMHGTPKGAGRDSWDDLSAMEPDREAVDLAKLTYVGHGLERVVLSADTKAPGKPPDYQTLLFKTYDALLLHTYSPLGEGMSRTLQFRFTD